MMQLLRIHGKCRYGSRLSNALPDLLMEGQFGLEVAISTDKLHQRGPIGLQHLVTNKWYIYGNGQISKRF
jgi:gamma-glutamyl phosphate reductase